MHFVLSILLNLLLTTAVFAADFTGPVVSVLDGDTIKVLHNQRPERIRLKGIDCPENGQAYSRKAKQAASALVFGKNVTLQVHGKDKYGRTLADVLLTDGMIVNHELVKAGWCWWYRKYAPRDTVLEGLEKDARDTKKGLWVDPAPIPSWVYRKARRGNALYSSDILPLDDENERNPSSRRPPAISPLLGAIEKDSESSTATSPYPVIGNRRSRISHRPGCRTTARFRQRIE